MNKLKEPKLKKTTIGGQAVIEGVMMRARDSYSLVIRRPDGSLDISREDFQSLNKKYKILSLPIIRGAVGLMESMFLGTKLLAYSAEFYDQEQEEKEGLIERIFKERADDIYIALSLVLSVFLSLVFFMLIPTLASSFFKSYLKSAIALNLVEGLIRVLIFLIYIVAISKNKDIERVFQYHGAEHKSIHCYESGLDLNLENAREKSMLHPRCGTSFLFTVMMVSILTLSFFGWPNPLQRLVNRIVMFPIIAGISYEINKIIGRSDSKLSYLLSYPGLMIQKYATVKEPDDSQLETALEALKLVIPENEDDDKW